MSSSFRKKTKIPLGARYVMMSLVTKWSLYHTWKNLFRLAWWWLKKREGLWQLPEPDKWPALVICWQPECPTVSAAPLPFFLIKTFTWNSGSVSQFSLLQSLPWTFAHTNIRKQTIADDRVFRQRSSYGIPGSELKATDCLYFCLRNCFLHFL